MQNIKIAYYFSLKDRLDVQLNLKVHKLFYSYILTQQNCFCVTPCVLCIDQELSHRGVWIYETHFERRQKISGQITQYFKILNMTTLSIRTGYCKQITNLIPKLRYLFITTSQTIIQTREFIN
jgi:hypothetical protein